MTRENDRSAWAMGYAAFAGVILIMLGFYRAAAGLVALFNDEFYVETEKYLFQFDVTAWGWINLIIGIGVLVAGFGMVAKSKARSGLPTFIMIFTGMSGRESSSIWVCSNSS